MTNDWESCAQPERLDEGEVHLWLVSLEIAPERSAQFRPILSVDERERADRFRKTDDCEHYIAARGSLRSLLGAYLETAPERLQFVSDALGKPGLAGEAADSSMNFSVSHSGDHGLLGFVRGHRIGVDLEFVGREVEVEDLARRFFSASEFQKLRTLPADQQREAFYRAWTRKEAYLKGRGEGLSYGLDRVEVSLAPDEPAMILKTSDDPDVSERWTLQHLSPAPGYVGAAAVEAANIAFRCFRWVPT